MIEYMDDIIPIRVKLDGKLVGHIKTNAAIMFYYKPLTGKKGNFFKSIEGVKRSIEGR